MIAYRKTRGGDGKYLPLFFDKLTSGELEIFNSVPDKIDFVCNELFDSSDAEETLFGKANNVVDIPMWSSFPETGITPSATAPVRKSLNRSDEATLFIRYNYARYRLSDAVAQQINRKTLRRTKNIIMWQSRVLSTRTDLVNANMALVVAMAKRTRINGVEFIELVSEGNMALLRSIEKFDTARGFKFSTYACRAILKSFSRLATKSGRYRSRFPTEFNPDFERSDYDTKKHEFQRDDSIESLLEILNLNHANLSDIEQTVVKERFALGSDLPKGQTLATVGKMVGLTNERVRQIQKHALGKIKVAMCRIQ